MPIGYQTTLSTSLLNNNLGANAVELFDACENNLRFFNEVVNVIGIAGLQAPPYNMDSSDATLFYNTANYLQTVAQVFFGTASSIQFNYADATGAARSGQ